MVCKWPARVLAVTPRRAEDPTVSEPQTGAEVHIFGGTLAAGWVMPRLYGRLAGRLGRDAASVHYHPMPGGGLGRTDRIVDEFAERLERAALAGRALRLAGHSLGGTVAWALAHELAPHVERVELYGAPLRGTRWAATWAPLPEARFLSPMSRWLRRYDQPLDGPVVRSVYSWLDTWVAPPRKSSHVEGSAAENHFLVPIRLPRHLRREGERLHSIVCDHAYLPAHVELQRRLADAA